VNLPNEAMEETEPAHDHVRNRFECPSPANRKRPRTCLAESGQMAARTNQKGNATGSCSSVEKDDGRGEEDPKPPLVTTSALIIGSDPDQEVVLIGSYPKQAVVQKGEATPYEIPYRVELEPDSNIKSIFCASTR
jgi:hypothetical protein